LKRNPEPDPTSPGRFWWVPRLAVLLLALAGFLADRFLLP
jgi:hypothetical protein